MSKKNRSNECYQGGPKSQFIIPQYLSKDSRSVFLPICYDRSRKGVIAYEDRGTCEHRRCVNYSRAIPDSITEQLRRLTMKHKQNRHSRPETIQYQECVDNISQFFPYCANPDHPGIVYWDKAQKCENEHCKFYNKFRPPIRRRDKPRKPIILKCFEDLHISMLK